MNVRAAVSTITFVVAIVVLLSTILWRLFVFFDRTDEDRFEYGLTPGMTRAAVISLENAYHGRLYGGGAQPAYISRRPVPAGGMSVYFTDEATFCIASGKYYILNFDRKGHLLNWTVEPWSGVC
jgi:hypothetical protein